jgi:hypothetical protein
MSTHSVLRYEAALKVTGSAIYEAEVPRPACCTLPSCSRRSVAAMCRRSTRHGGDSRASRRWSPMRIPGATGLATALIRNAPFISRPTCRARRSKARRRLRDAAHAIQVSLEARPA